MNFILFLGIITFLKSLYFFYKLLISYINKKINLNDKYNSKWALITGASSGLGKNLSILLSKQKINIIGIGRNIKNLEKVKNEVQENGVIFLPIQANLCELTSIEDIIKNIEDKDIGIFILNAGYGLMGNFNSFSNKEIINYINSMCISNCILTNYFINKNKNRLNQSVIYFVSSIASDFIFPLSTLYCSVKKFLTIFSQKIFINNFDINIIHPGPFSNSNFFNNILIFNKFLSIINFLFQSSNNISKIILNTMGSYTLIDSGISTLFMRIIFWLINDLIDKYIYILCYKIIKN